MPVRTEAKANLAFAVAIVLLLSISVVRYFSTQNLVERSHWVSHTHEAIAQINRITYLSESVESAARGALLTHAKRELDALANAQTELNTEIEALRVLIGDNPRQVASVSVVKGRVDEFFERQRALLAGGWRESEALPLMDVVQEHLKLMTAEEERLLKERMEHEDKTLSRITFLSIGGTVVSLAILTSTMYVLNRVIAARRKAEADYRDSEDRVRLLLNSTSEGVYGMDTEGKCTFCNPACLRILGFQRQDDLIGKNMHELIHHTTANGVPIPVKECRIYKAFADKAEIHVTDEVFWRADKSCFPVDYRSCPMMQQGQPIGAVVTFTDITDRKKAEQVMARSRDMAMESARLKSEFLANMSHEIRTPLNGVIGMSELLIGSRLNVREREYALTIRNSAEALLTILNDILDLSKIEAGKLTLEAIPFDLRLIVEEVGMLIASRASEKKLELIVRYTPETPRAFTGDPVRIRQVLSNLASNAVKFTQEGYVLIAVSCIGRENGRAKLRITVEDTGIGINEDFRTRMFQKFVQADASTTRQFGGTGLGLAICKNIIELMGGTISVTSELGKGTAISVEFSLPESTDAALPDDTREGLRVPMGRCLVVDDNAVNRMVVVEQLNAWHVPATAVESAEAAQAELRRAAAAGEKYAVAILDYQMPGTNGEMLARAIKADAQTKDTVLVLLSSIGETFSRAYLAESGIIAMLHKPVRQSELFDTLQRAWRAASRGDDMTFSSGNMDAIVAETEAPALNMRILLVEDNDVNRTVAVGMLKKLNCSCSIAVDGSEAVASLKKERFDVVLMDCQMPVMDGYTATQEIRRHEKDTGKTHQPIVAMTANAMQGDRERCLDAGMDDYLPKPVRLAALADVLTRATGRCVVRRRSKPRVRVPELVTAGPAPAQPVFDEAAALSFAGGDVELLRNVVTVFRGDVPRRIEQFKAAVQVGDGTTAERSAHSIKGAAANVGGERLRVAAYRIEALCRDGEYKQAAALIPGLDLEFAALLQAFDQSAALKPD